MPNKTKQKIKTVFVINETKETALEISTSNPNSVFIKNYIKNPKLIVCNPAWECFIDENQKSLNKNEALSLLLSHMTGFKKEDFFGCGIIVFHNAKNCKELFTATQNWFRHHYGQENGF